jgi:ABC-type multidrug transport system ATPase subunit
MNRVAVAVENLTKRFDERIALDGIGFEIAEGEVFGFLGPDGAGKSTLFRILTTLLVADSGNARVLGLDVVMDLWALRRRLGYMPGRFSLYTDLTVEENLRFFAMAFGTTLEAQYEVIAPIYHQIEPFRDRAAGALSGGMKQKLALCCALVHRPEILFLDEPTTGVDAVSRREFWDLLGVLQSGGLTIVVSTPYMDEADRCDRVALVQHGSLMAVDTPQAIVDRYPLPLFEVRGSRRNRLLGVLREFEHVHSAYPFGDTLHYTDARSGFDGERLVRELTAYTRDAGFADVSVQPARAGIEDSFMLLMNEQGTRTEAV